MPFFPMPVNRLYVPDGAPAVPEGFTRVRQTLDRGLPATLALDAELSLVVYVPTGDANLWRGARGDEIVSRAADENAARVPGSDDLAARAPVRLVLRRAGANLAALALVVGGGPRRLPDGVPGVAALVDLLVLDYQICAGSLREEGAFGSYVDLAWRRVGAGSDRFALPPLPERVAARFSVIRSQVGE